MSCPGRKEDGERGCSPLLEAIVPAREFVLGEVLFTILLSLLNGRF